MKTKHWLEGLPITFYTSEFFALRRNWQVTDTVPIWLLPNGEAEISLGRVKASQ
jgi:hypothetical protein